jgi:farnesyl diphosphate synthase
MKRVTMNPESSDFARWSAELLPQIESALAAHLPPESAAPQRLHAAMRYATLGGGKRVRPLLCHAASEAVGASAESIAVLASAVECIHVYSLVHDDLPAMDNDDLRRGRPTCHVAFDEATALLVGDALQSLAFELAARPLPGVSAERQLQMIHLLASASGSHGMAGGQAIDIAAVGKQISVAELEYMHIRKTGALIRASVLLGAHAGNADASAIDALTHYANRLGLLFQVVDDILDAECDSAALGKTAGKDQAADKPTYYSLLGSAAAHAAAEQLHADACTALTPFGARAIRLKQLADFVMKRRH